VLFLTDCVETIGEPTIVRTIGIATSSTTWAMTENTGVTSYTVPYSLTVPTTVTVTQPLPSSTNTQQDESNSTPAGSIAGATVGSIAGVAIIGIAGWLLYRRRQRKEQYDSKMNHTPLTPSSSSRYMGSYSDTMSSSQHGQNLSMPPNQPDSAQGFRPYRDLRREAYAVRPEPGEMSASTAVGGAEKATVELPTHSSPS
jgi:LPXTG-motif cell wall-anchored protein